MLKLNIRIHILVPYFQVVGTHSALNKSSGSNGIQSHYRRLFLGRKVCFVVTLQGMCVCFLKSLWCSSLFCQRRGASKSDDVFSWVKIGLPQPPPSTSISAPQKHDLSFVVTAKQRKRKKIIITCNYMRTTSGSGSPIFGIRRMKGLLGRPVVEYRFPELPVRAAISPLGYNAKKRSTFASISQ